jgi:hypothetical protein
MESISLSSTDNKFSTGNASNGLIYLTVNPQYGICKELYQSFLPVFNIPFTYKGIEFISQTPTCGLASYTLELDGHQRNFF